MTYDSSLSKPDEKAAYLRLFDALAGHNLLLEANPPHFTILAATPQRLQEVGMTKEAVIGKALFEAHPGNSTDPTDNGITNLRASLDHVIRYKEIHRLPVQRYDLPDGRGDFSEKYWRACNRPVLDEEGEVAYIIHTAEDITAQIRETQREIWLAGVEKVFSLFMHAPVVVGLVNGNDYVLEVANEAAFTLWGKGPEEIIGKPILEGLPELKGQGIIELFDRVRSSGEPYTAHEVPVASWVNGKKEQHYFNLVYQPYYDKNNAAATGVFTISHDVTEQVLAKKKIEESEAKYQTLFNSMDQGFCILEMIFDDAAKPIDYRFLEVNPMFEKQTGLVEAAGKRVKELVPDLEPHWFELYGKVALTGESVRFAEGSETMGRWFDVFAFRIGDADSRKVALLFTDISEQKKAEAGLKQSESNLRNMILQSPIAMAILKGSSFVVEIANDRMYELWGRGQNELLNKSIFVGLPEVRDQGYEELLTGVFTTGKSFSALGIPVTLPRENRIETVYINLLYEAFREADGSISGVMAVASDVTEQVLARQKIEEVVEQRTKELASANEALQQTNKELQRSNQNLEEFAHAASHDLKEPIRKIQFFSHQLKEQLADRLGEKEKFSFGRIEHATGRMGNLIDDLLLYSHVSQRPHQTESIDLNVKVQRVLEDLELDIQEKGAVINVGSLPVVQGYRRQLQQLFQNLISNALKYRKAGAPPRIDIRAEETEENKMRYNVISVQDNGIGFDLQYTEKIFQMFSRLHGKHEYSGTGVGLSIVKKVVENHHGFIRVESTVGEGSLFKIYLPV